MKVIWNQCEDPDCNQVRSPLTINKDNFISDLRFRIVSENLLSNNNLTQILNSDLNDSNDVDLVNKKNEREILSNDVLTTTSTTASSVDDMSTDINSWNLEIRRFSKNDEACYQCQLNSFKTKTIYYCIKLQSIFCLIIFLFLLNIEFHCFF